MAAEGAPNRDREAVRLGRGSLASIGSRLPVPRYDGAELRGGIVHIGVGGFHRSHLAAYVHDLLQAGCTRYSIVGAGLLPSDAEIARALQAQDGLYVLIQRDGAEAHAGVIGSISEYLFAADDSRPLVVAMAEPATHIVSLTITEGGYPVEAGEFVETAQLQEDARSQSPTSAFGVIACALEARHRAGLAPFTVMSCDNLPGNGDVARRATLGAAAMRSDQLARWIDSAGAFPNAMVDRITPATTDVDRRFVRRRFGFEDRWPVTCEPFRQWALEDEFCDGRPPFEQAGALTTSDVSPYEQMKLRLLNGSHTGLAYHAALAGIELVDQAMAEPAIERFVRALMRDEIAPNLDSPKGIDLADYQKSLVHRFSNPAIGDQIARVCLDGSSKFPSFIVPSLEAQLDRGQPVRMLALVIAGWCRYLQGRADDGALLTLAPDPYLDEAIAAAHASREDPRRFLQYSRAMGGRLATSDDLVATFTEALASLERAGSLATLSAWAP
jgi:mannitol 2-dehydrogenase